MKINLVGGFLDTRINHEDFALTPYLFTVYALKGMVIGIGICWGWYSVYVGLGFNLPSGYLPHRFKIKTYKK